MIDQAQALVGHPWWRYLWPPAAGLLVFLVGLSVRWILISRLNRFVTRTRWTWDDLILAAVRGPSALWCLIAAVYVTVLAWPVSEAVQGASSRLLTVLWVLSFTLAAMKVAGELILKYSDKLAGTLPLTSLTQNLTKGLILVMGGLMILNGLGISITPLLTALGVGGLAVALALQETLSNLFAGIYVTMARQIRVGDYIKLDSGEEGYVTDVGWRSTRIRNLPNNLIIIPNTKLAQAIVTNYDLPSQDMAVLVQVGVDYRSELEHVEKVTVEVGKEIMRETGGGMPEFEPFIRYHTFSDSSVNFTVILRGKTFVDQYLIKHEFIKRLHKRYGREGIVIPFPIRTVILEPPPK